MGKVKRLELWWQLYCTSLPERDVWNIMPMDFCSTECTKLSANDNMVAEYWIGNYVCHSDCVLTFAWSDWGNLQNFSASIASLWTKFWTCDLPGMKQACFSVGRWEYFKSRDWLGGLTSNHKCLWGSGGKTPCMFHLLLNGSDLSSSYSGYFTTWTRVSIVCW